MAIGKSLKQILIEQGLISSGELEEAIEEQRLTGKPLLKTLVDLGYISKENLMELIASQVGMDIVKLDQVQIDKDAVNKVPASVVRMYNIMPVSFKEERLTVALSDPIGLSILDDLRFLLSCDVKGLIADEAQIQQSIHKYYGGGTLESIQEVVTEIKEKINMGKEVSDVASLQELASQPPVVKLINLILLEAIKNKASDIHFEPFEDEYRIRYRIDGVVYEAAQPPLALSPALSSRIKVMANLDVAESRLPQDGRIMMNIERKQVDLRVSTLPTIFGESVVLRVLDRSTINLSLDQLGLAEELDAKLRILIQKPNGIILVTGPTGSGKTTTLYSCLQEINKPECKVITVEDPVEYDIPGIIQVSIKPKIDLSFAKALRHILRQDPDIIMIGEIRDAETAGISIQASLTGHLVFSTLHTNDAPSAVTRLVDMGVEPYLIASTLEGVLAQRLVRVICETCKETYRPSEKELTELKLSPEEIENKTFYRGRGCENCNNSGYKGRTGIFELLIVNEAFRSLIVERPQIGLLRNLAMGIGMRTLREDGLKKAYEGITTIEEVIRETQWYV